MNIKRISYLLLVIVLALGVLMSMGGVALAVEPTDVIDPVMVDPDGPGPEQVQCCEPVTRSLDQQDENMGEWHFVLNQWDNDEHGPKPAWLYVMWNDGTYGQFPLSTENLKMGHYYATHDDQQGIKVEAAWVSLEEYPAYNNCETYDGNLVLSYTTPPIPELSPIILMGIGLLGLAGYLGWKKRKVVTG